MYIVYDIAYVVVDITDLDEEIRLHRTKELFFTILIFCQLSFIENQLQ